MDEQNIVIVLDKIYRRSYMDCSSFDPVDNINHISSKSLQKLKDYLEIECESDRYLVINYDTSKIAFKFRDLIIEYIIHKDNYAVLLYDCSTLIDQSMIDFIDECLRYNSDDSIWKLYNNLCEFADKYIIAYDNLVNVSI